MIELITTCSSAAITAISIIIAIIQTIKKGKKSKTVELAKVVQKIPEFITEAEQIIGTGKGVAKLQYVLNKIQLQCQLAGIEFQEQQFKQEVEKILETPQKKITKQMLKNIPIPKVNFNNPEWYSPYGEGEENGTTEDA